MIYDGVKLDAGYRLDLLVNQSIILEIKAVDYIAPIHRAQLMTYLKLSGHRLGLLLNFNVIDMKEGISRIIM
jgi:GxxExxY protein